jgi:hypothetical protein
LLDLIGLESPSDSPAFALHPAFAPSPDDIDAVCDHVISLGAALTDCPAHFSNIARLDREHLWTGVGDCVRRVR